MSYPVTIFKYIPRFHFFDQNYWNILAFHFIFLYILPTTFITLTLHTALQTSLHPSKATALYRRASLLCHNAVSSKIILKTCFCGYDITNVMLIETHSRIKSYTHFECLKTKF